MSPYELRARIQKEPDPAPVKRQPGVPYSVACLALYEVVKAAGFLLIFAQIWTVHETQSAAGNSTYDPILTEPRFLLFPFAATVFLTLAWGIWRLQAWSRPAVIAALAVLAFYWWRPGNKIELIPWIFKQPNFVTAALLIDLTSIAALFLLTSVTEAFDQAAKARQT